MKLIKYFAIGAFALALPILASAALPPEYAWVVTSGDAVPGTTTYGTGAPDGQYIELANDDSWAEFGFSDTSNEDIYKAVLYETPAENIADRPWIKMQFMNGAEILQTSYQRIDSTSEENRTSYLQDDEYDRIRFTKLSGDTLAIDAVWYLGDMEGEPESEPDPEPIDEPDPDPEPELYEDDDNANMPRLIKLFNDGDPNAQHDTAVYVVDDDGKRRPFFNETIFYSWFTDFSTVEEIDAEEMASYMLGASVPMHQGTWLVKIQSTNDVYAVSQGGTLHRIPDESTAIELYGPDWATRVRDISPTDWPHYTVGDEVLASIYPDDTVIKDESFIVWHIRNGVRRQIPTLDLVYHGVQDAHIVQQHYNADFDLESGPTNIDLSAYVIGAMYTTSDDFGWWDL